MSTSKGVKHQAKDLFDKHIRLSHSLDDLEMLDALLPRDASVLRALQAYCMGEAQKAMEAGHHIEGRRFGNLARQAQKLADKADRR